MKYIFLFICVFPLVVFSGQKEGSGGDPLIEEFFHRGLYSIRLLKGGMVSGRQASIYEGAYRDLRVDITDRELLTTGRVMDDPKRPGKKYVLLDRNKFFKLLINSPGGDITAFVVHEVFSTKGFDVNYEITRELRFNEDDYQRWKVENIKHPTERSEIESRRSFDTLRQIDGLDALWSNYKFHFIKGGRVVSLDEGNITTSEGQGYALLRAVWSNDRVTFERVWNWTRQNLQIRGDKVFAWKWKGAVLDRNNASDGDTDIALALILASRRFRNESYERHAVKILDSLWKTSVAEVKGSYYMSAGNWAKEGDLITIHVGYLAPYAYEVFSKVDYAHPWKRLVDSSYHVLHEIYDRMGLSLPPERVYLSKDGKFHVSNGAREEVFGYDTVPIFFRLALDKKWNYRRESPLYHKMLSFFVSEWEDNGKFFERYRTEGKPQSRLENLPLYASVYALASQVKPEFAEKLLARKVSPLLTQGVEGKTLPYYLHNWLWFSHALRLDLLTQYDEFMAFLRPFDFAGFQNAFPWILFGMMLSGYLLRQTHRGFFIMFFASAVGLCVRYLWWRATETLNFIEPLGPFISISLLVAEGYGFSTVLLLILQMGFGKKEERRRPQSKDFAPTVDIYVPIFSEPLEILERTLVGCRNLDYPKARIYVLDDGHRAEVRKLTESMGAQYIQGPKKHAKAGNLNHALSQTQGEFVLVFDTDHIPVRTFLGETIPYFIDETVGFVQTPHFFYNEDIFQRAFPVKGMPNEQDMFNHAIQGGRDRWGAAIFSGSGAVFRRKALESIGGFKLLSITEDIHTSQHLHAANWKSIFVDRNLAVGLTAENFAAHTIQRARWMQGCLQIFFKDNSLACKGLDLRQRLGYFASHYYFLFPVFRIIFFLTPLYYLFFHLHPVFSDVSVLVAYLVPFMVALPMMTNVILPAWPRLFWGTAYEYAVCLSLFRSTLELILPKSLGFKVTPKGLLTEKRMFDKESSRLTVVATGLVLAAILKGLIEFYYFGIEKDAYFFNLAWASVNLFFLCFALLLAWEKPQRRREHRVRINGIVELETESGPLSLDVEDVSLTGIGVSSYREAVIPERGMLTLRVHESALSIPYEKVRFVKASRKRYRGGLRFLQMSKEMEHEILRNTFAHPKTWENAHEKRSRSNLYMGFAFVGAMLKGLRPKGAVKTVAIILILTSIPAHASLKETWYLSRGRSNMEIKNYRAAIEAFENAERINPESEETIKSLGLAYEAQGLRDKSIAAFDKYLAKRPDDYAIAFKQAQTLGWSRYSYRENDALNYFRQGLSQRNDSRMRLKYASLLSRKRSSISEAIDQYQKVLRENPKNREAHVGLARAYAWNGNRDLADYHASEASSAGAVEVRGLQSDLRRGHEPEVGGGFEVLYQPNSTFNREGFSVGASMRQDIGPFVTVNGKGGWEYFSGNAIAVNGLYFVGRAQYRASETIQTNFDLGYHSMGDRRYGTAIFGANLRILDQDRVLGLGVERTLIGDSLISYVGKQDGRRRIGAARLVNFYSDFEWNLHPFVLRLRPQVGFVTSESAPGNFRGGATLSPSVSVYDSASWQIGFMYRASLLHYGRDHSGVSYSNQEPYGGGYFSPRFYFEHAPLANVRWRPTDRYAISLEMGPTFQVVHQFAQEDAFQIGIVSNGSIEYHANRNLTLWLNFGFTEVNAEYTRFSAASGLSYAF